MSKSIDRQLLEDRALRDAALALVKADVEHVKADFSTEGLVSRFARRMSEGATDVYEEAAEVADDNKGLLAALVAAVVLWFARNPIMSLFDDEFASEDEEYEDGEQGEFWDEYDEAPFDEEQ